MQDYIYDKVAGSNHDTHTYTHTHTHTHKVTLDKLVLPKADLVSIDALWILNSTVSGFML